MLSARRRTRPGIVAGIVAAAMLLAACGGGDDSKSSDTTDSTGNGGTSFVKPPKTTAGTTTTEARTTAPATTAGTTVPETTAATDAPPPAHVPGKVDDIIIRETVDDLNQWWTKEFPGVYPAGKYFGPIAGAYSLHPGDTVQCGTVTVKYDDVADNAIYAPCDDKTDGIFFDTEKFIPGLVASSGQFAGALIAAPEWGHLLQRRGGESNDVSIFTELQADCFAGSWVNHVIKDGTPFEMTGSDVDVALAALIGIGDPTGLASTVKGAHGTAFDRVSAFTSGLKDVQSCVSFQTSPPPVFEMPFTTTEEQQTGGNLDLPTLLDLAGKDLTTYFTKEVDPNYPLPGPLTESDCDGETVVLKLCKSQGIIAINVQRLTALHEFLGDWATATLLARAYAENSGISDDVSNCMTGAFDQALYAAVGDPNSPYNLQLSSGDLSESVRVFLIESKDGSGIVATDNLRAGLLGGLAACQKIAKGG